MEDWRVLPEFSSRDEDILYVPCHSPLYLPKSLADMPMSDRSSHENVFESRDAMSGRSPSCLSNLSNAVGLSSVVFLSPISWEEFEAITWYENKLEGLFGCYRSRR